MSKHERHETCVYIGPAALCPIPEQDQPYILITGDQEDWVQPLIQERLKRMPEGQLLAIRQNTIGKPGTTKTWHTFNHPSLNGIFEEKDVRWCNPSWNIEHLRSGVAENRKLQDILSELDLGEKAFQLVIAQGDPQLTLKRSEKILKHCKSVDLTLHPFALIWKNSINTYLSERGFKNHKTNQLFWHKSTIEPPQQPHASPSESEHFIHPTVQYLLKSIDLEEYRKAGFGGSDLFMLRQIVAGNIGYKPEQSIKNILSARVKRQIETLLKGIQGENRKNKTPVQANKGNKIDASLTLPTVPSREGKGINASKQLRGHIDGFQGGLTLHGWVDASDFGEGPSTVSVIWEEENQTIGEGQAILERPDLAAAGINLDCGFAIDLKILQKLPLNQTLDRPISLRVIESKSQQLIGEEPWELNIRSNQDVMGFLFSDELPDQRKEQILDYLKTTKNPKYLVLVRKQILKFTATQCMTNRWQSLPVMDVIRCWDENSALNYGIPQESASRLELVLLAWIKLIETVDSDGINRHSGTLHKVVNHQAFNHLDAIASSLKERGFTGLQKWEKALFDEHIRPLYDVLIATIFLQSKHSKLKRDTVNLIDTLAHILQEVYSAPKLSFHLRSILKAQDGDRFDTAFAKLAHERGDRFTYLLSHYSKELEEQRAQHNLFYYAAAIDFASYCPAIHRSITNKFQNVLRGHLTEHPRQSKPRHWVERLGFMASNSAQMLVSKMINLGFSRSSVVDLHQEMIKIKQDLANLLWDDPNTESEQQQKIEKSYGRQKWLIIGEKDLTQCWMYRVEQKKSYLESLGCQVRCIDQEELRYWSFTHDVLWADAVIFCRLPAMYPYLRAIAFAKQCKKRTYAEIDDLIFTSDYPAEFQSYGGSIPIEQYKNLCVDYPLRLGVLNAVDEVIVSTPVLADTCRNVLEDQEKPIHVIPNLPLPELEKTALRLVNEKAVKNDDEVVKIALTSGTLSHKQILKDYIYPVLLEALETYPRLELVTIGHIQLPSKFSKFETRIVSAPFSSYRAYLNLLEQCSIALVPLEVHPTTHAKSAIKWMEASLCRVACICSPVKAYTDVSINQQDVLIASNQMQWRTCLFDLIEKPDYRKALAREAYENASRRFNTAVGQKIWKELIRAERTREGKIKKKVLVINVFFAPQSVGGATRVAQDYVLKMLSDEDVDYDVTVLCTDYDRWQSDIGRKRKETEKESKKQEADSSKESEMKIRSLQGTSNEELLELQSDWLAEETSYRDSITVDYSTWKGAKVVRLNLSAKPWDVYEDEDIEAFCNQFFKNEIFDLIQCHCCQILTASPLVAAKKLKIPYEIIMHDAWWMSKEQFLVSPAGRLINPSNPLDHFDEEPSETEKSEALARRKDLYTILAGADRRVAVSAAFRNVCESAGISNVVVQENQFTSMNIEINQKSSEKSNEASIKICHIGGMSMHKGYQLFRQAVHCMQKGLNLKFTIVDHRLSTTSDEYNSVWNGYEVNFIAPIPMDEMNQFYASQDVLVAPSIWPESFGLVTREALSAGLWVIASDSGALAEPLLNNQLARGTVIRPNNLDDLVKALTESPKHLRQYV